MSGYEKIYVEGSNDKKTLDTIFAIKGEFKRAGNKAKVLKKVGTEANCCGITDRDFDSDEVVANSKQADSRYRILHRYCLENYLIEPKYLFQLAQSFGFDQHEDWNSESAIEQMILRKGQQLCHYAAANELLGRYAQNINFQQFPSYFDDCPVIGETEVRGELQQRFQNLPTREELDTELATWAQRATEIQQLCHTLEGVNRWINGKVLLRDVIYQEIVNVHSIFSRLSKDQFVEELALIAKEKPPEELVTILQEFGVGTL